MRVNGTPITEQLLSEEKHSIVSYELRVDDVARMRETV